MQPLTPRDFVRVALQRLTGAEEIMDKLRLTLEAQYIGGYSVECSLKALVLQVTPEAERGGMLAKLTKGATVHKPEYLLPLLKAGGIVLTPELAKRMRRFDWETAMRYEIGRKDTGETYALLNTARAMYEWAEPQIT
jgi:hypothetical protein